MRPTETLLANGLAAAAAGAPVAVLRAVVAAFPAASLAERRLLLGMLEDLLHHVRPLVRAEGAAMTELLRRLGGLTPSAEQLAALVGAVESRSEAQLAGRPGRVPCLFASTGFFAGERIGCVHHLLMCGSAWGNTLTLHLPWSGSEPSVRRSFQAGVLAAFEYLRQRGLPPLHGHMFLNCYRIDAQLPSVRTTLEGESLGLASAVGTVSVLLDLAVPADVSFSALVDIRQGLTPIGGLEPKLRAAADHGITRVFVAADQLLDGPCPDGVRLVQHRSLAQVVEDVFQADELSGGIDRLRAACVPNPIPERTWLMERVPDQGNRILLSAVGKSDPIGTHKDEHGRGFAQSEGPCLAAARYVRPSHAYLFFTTRDAAGQYNDFSQNAADTARYLAEQPGGCRVVLVPLRAVSDPTDVRELIEALAPHLQRISADHGPDPAYFTNASSGTGQMAVAWHLLAERRLLPGTLLQVREQRFVSSGSLVRPVALPHA